MSFDRPPPPPPVTEYGLRREEVELTGGPSPFDSLLVAPHLVCLYWLVFFI